MRELVADITSLHSDPNNAGCLFQVASQFNLLEMAMPSITPEQGVSIYAHDFTQGPACAIAAGAGTIYRNYFAQVNNQIGQSATEQIDCLADLGLALGNTEEQLWRRQNGYALASATGLTRINQELARKTPAEIDQLRELLRIGRQWNTQVTIKQSQHLVTQAYCSALPVAYSSLPWELWENFAKLILA